MRRRTLTKDEILEEYQLIKAAQKNPRRFGVLYERYYEQIFLFVYKRVDSEETCGDVTSQVFLKAMTNLKRYQYKGVPFSAWLYRIASNEVNQFFRDSQKERAISADSKDLVHIVEEIEEDGSEENIQQMLSAMKLLSREEVQMIEFRFFEKMPFKEIAEVYSITENNAKVKMYRLLGKMKKLMEKRRVKA